MKLVQSRVLRGPSVHTARPCVVACLDLAELGGVSPLRDAAFVARATAALDPLPDERLRRRLAGATTLAHAVAVVAVSLQRAVGGDVAFAKAERLRDAAGRRTYRVVVTFENDRHELARASLALAVRAVDAWARGRRVDIAGALVTLGETARESALCGDMRAVLAAARRRGIPALRLDDGGWQLGWGVRGQRLPDPGGGAPLPHGRTGAHVVASLFRAGDDGRIPTVAITGSNGKTTTTLLVSHVLRASGSTVGTTTTEGIFIDGRRIATGDCTGPQSARTLFRASDVDAAVLETARGGILKRGIGFDRCDVGVVLNVTGDHLGLDGVETLADLARVKGLVARLATRAAVLNADDAHCVAMARRLRAGCETVYFAMSPRTPAYAAHVAAGGRGACLDDGELVLHDAGARQPLVDAARLPIAMGGHARHHVANALATAAAATCLGIDRSRIADALVAFVSDAANNPLRGNRYDWDGVELLVDYAHNPAAYEALGATGRAIADARGARLVGVVTSPGDRRSRDLFDTGVACGRAFDDLVVYEVHPRGRAPGETTEAILAGARTVSRGVWLQGIPDVAEALAVARARCRAGDLLVVACASLAMVIDAVRQAAPHVADRIAEDARADGASRLPGARLREKCQEEVVPTRAMRQQIIDRALGEGASSAADAGAIATATVRAVGLLLAELKPLVGGLAASALYIRSLHLAKTSIVRPASIRGADVEAELATLRDNLASRDAADAGRVARAIVDCLVDVLCSLIGTPLTHRMLRTAWDIPVADLPPEESKE